MSERGFVAIDRDLFNHSSFAQEPFTEREAWMWLICSAVWKPTRVRVGRRTFALERGQCAFSVRFLATKWRWSSARVHRFLDRLKSETMVSTLANHDATQITICNYDKYQKARDADEPRGETASETLARHSRDKEEQLNKETKEEDDAPKGAVAFESGVIRLNQKDFDQWRQAFTHLDLRAELLSLSEWARGQPKWFFAVSSALAKRNRELKLRAEAESKNFKLRSGMEGVL